MTHYLRKHTTWLLMAIILCGGAVFFVVAYAAGIEPKLINFQAYLTDSQGNPLQGTQELTFRLWNSETGGTVFWTETHPNAMVINGNVSVLLGSNMPLTIPFDLSHDWYLGISVGSAPEMTPRQRLLPSHHSVVSSRLVVSHPNGSRSEFGVNEIVPVGGIITYFGDPGNLPGNWKVCDGSQVNDPESPFNGQSLPDLRAKFVRGEATENRSLSTISDLSLGGADTVSTLHVHPITSDGAHNHDRETSQAGRHEHNFTSGFAQLSGSEYAVGTGDARVDLPNGVYASAVTARGTGDHIEIFGREHYHSGSTSTAGEHLHVIPLQPAHNHGGQTGAVGNPAMENRPAFVALHYIIRIK